MTNRSSSRRVAALALAGLCAAAACSSPHAYRGDARRATYSATGSSSPVCDETRVTAAREFPSPNAAVQAFDALLGLHDKSKIEDLFGPGATQVLWTGDDTADLVRARQVKAMIAEGVAFEPQGEESVIAALGKDRYPFPIPIVKERAGWHFDLPAGTEELLNRRVGRYELATIETMYDYLDAQREYFSERRDGNAQSYAQKIRSTPGKHDGLYWDTEEGKPQSPLGPLVTEGRTKGYDVADDDDEPDPFQGYYYRILTGQGAKVAGGRASYVENGLMTRGFAVVAWPATYGNSGIMTFVVNQAGVVFQKDLGRDTAKIAAAMTEYDPDKSWKPTSRPAEDE